MAKVYRTPENMPPPTPDYGDWPATHAAEQVWVMRLAEVAKRNGTSKLLGEVVRFPIADGYAEYMVWTTTPLALVHLALGDAYAIPDAHARGLRLADIKHQVESAKALRELFARAREEESK